MAEEATPLVRIFLTLDPLTTGTIRETMAEIRGEAAFFYLEANYTCCAPEGSAWHRTRWAAENFAHQLQMQRVRDLRDEIARVEGLRFRGYA